MQLRDAPPLPSQVAPDAGIPRALEEVVMRALAKSPAQRAQHAADMAKEIEAAMANF